MKDFATDSLLVDEFFFHGSFLTAEAYYAQNKVYPKEWDKLMAFLQKVTTPFLAKHLTLELDRGVSFLPLLLSKSLLLRLYLAGDEHPIVAEGAPLGPWSFRS
jgi:hypothetical protein